MQSEPLRHSLTEDRIDLADTSSVEHWAAKLGTSPEQLRELVARVGPRVSDVAAKLSRPDSLD